MLNRPPFDGMLAARAQSKIGIMRTVASTRAKYVPKPLWNKAPKVLIGLRPATNNRNDIRSRVPIADATTRTTSRARGVLTLDITTAPAQGSLDFARLALRS